MKKFVSAILIAIGILGTFASVIAMPESSVRTIFLIACLVLACAGLFGFLSQQIDWLSAWSVLRQCKLLGIRRISSTGIGKGDLEHMANAKNLGIMAVSAIGVVRQRKPEIVSALREQRALIRILLAQSDSQFVSDVENIESPHRAGQISSEICVVEGLLDEYMDEAASGKRIEEFGKIEIGFYTTHLRSSLILCDNNWGWLTLNLPPKRAVQTVSLELTQVKNGLLEDCISHFDRCWEIAEQSRRTFQILPKRKN